MDASASPELVSEALAVPAAEGSADAFLIRPAAGGPFPGVVLHMDAFGLRPALRAHAERLARHGYCVLVPNAYYRTVGVPVVAGPGGAHAGRGPRGRCSARSCRYMRALTPDVVTADARAWIAFLRGQPDAADGPVGTVGYCMGGRQALRMAGELPDDVGAAASFHGGGLATDAPDSPHLRGRPGDAPSSTSGTPTTTAPWSPSRWAASRARWPRRTCGTRPSSTSARRTAGRRPTRRSTTRRRRSATGCG